MPIDYVELVKTLEEGAELAIYQLIDLIANAPTPKIKLDACKVLLSKVLPDLEMNLSQRTEKLDVRMIKAKLNRVIGQLDMNKKIEEKSSGGKDDGTELEVSTQ